MEFLSNTIFRYTYLDYDLALIRIDYPIMDEIHGKYSLNLLIIILMIIWDANGGMDVFHKKEMTLKSNILFGNLNF